MRSAGRTRKWMARLNEFSELRQRNEVAAFSGLNSRPAKVYSLSISSWAGTAICQPRSMATCSAHAVEEVPG